MSKIPALRQPSGRNLPAQPVKSTLSMAEIRDDASWWGSALEQVELPGIRASGLCFDQCLITRVNLAGSQLPNLKCSDVEFRQSNLANLEVSEATLFRTAFLGGKLSGLRLSESSCHDLELRDCKMDYTLFHGVKFKQVVFRGCDLREVEFHDCRFDSVQWIDCHLGRASFLNTRFNFGEFRRCALEGLRGIASLRGASFERDELPALASAMAVELGLKILD